MSELVLHEAEEDTDLPAWSLPRDAAERITIDNPLPQRVDADWAFGGATGRGVRVCILDSGVEAGHPLVGELAGAVGITVDEDGNPSAEPDEEGDLLPGRVPAGGRRRLGQQHRFRLTAVGLVSATSG